MSPAPKETKATRNATFVPDMEIAYVVMDPIPFPAPGRGLLHFPASQPGGRPGFHFKNALPASVSQKPRFSNRERAVRIRGSAASWPPRALATTSAPVMPWRA